MEILLKKQPLYIVKKTPLGLFVNTKADQLLGSMTLTREESASLLEKGVELGQPIDAYLYHNQQGKLSVTLTPPKLELGQIGLLKVVQTNSVGAFVDVGYEKDVLLPFNEQLRKVAVGEEIMVGLYLDKSGRACATQKLRKFLLSDCPYQEGDVVTGLIYDIHPEMGAFVAIDRQYFGLIFSNEVLPSMKVGQEIMARITQVREDGKANLTINKRIDLQMDEDSEKILSMLKDNEGYLPYHDKTDSEIIRRVFDMSKKGFKRAVGKLYKEKYITMVEGGIQLNQED